MLSAAISTDMAKRRILVVDGNTRDTDDAHVAAGGNPTGEHYARVLSSLRGDIECTLVHPARAQSAALPINVGLRSFDGVAWTGSALNVYKDIPPVRAQIELARAVFEAGVPQFGSCWGLQVAAVAAGGRVHANPRGRELGFARRIALTDAGATHPMLRGKPALFDAIAVHMDEIAEMPAASTVLAGNGVSAVQAAEIRYKAGTFWGTQYHPEYDLNEIATVIIRYGQRLVQAGFFADMPALTAFVDDVRALHAEPTRKDLAWRYALAEDVLDPSSRHIELKRWIDH
jgi:GMP synthase (glutamine-hydrolysing)